MFKTAIEASEHRRRLLDGMAAAVAGKGYADTTVADVVREAAVSRRTFYEHFATKAECFVALFEAASRQALDVLRHAHDPQQPWHAQVERSLGAYLGSMAAEPQLVRTLFLEILGLGAPGLAARRRMYTEIADYIQSVVDTPDGPLPPDMAMALVGGINEMILVAVEQDRVADLAEWVGPASRLVRAVADGPGPAA